MAIENNQNLIVEGCYIPFSWRQDFDETYQSNIRFVCLAMSEKYIETNYCDIAGHESDIESRFVAPNISVESLKEDNIFYISGFQKMGEHVVVIDSCYEQVLQGLID